MNHAESNPVLEAMAQSQMAGTHPDADVLTAFAEGGLLSRERDAVMVHLAECVECREAILVAVEAGPAPVHKQVEELKPQLVPSRMSPRGWILWAGIAASLLAAATILLVQRERPTDFPRAQMAFQAPKAAVIEPAPAAMENRLEQAPQKEASPESKAAAISALKGARNEAKTAKPESANQGSEPDDALAVSSMIAPAIAPPAAPAMASPAQDALKVRQEAPQSLPSMDKNLAPSVSVDEAQVFPSAEATPTPHALRGATAGAMASSATNTVHSFGALAKAATAGARSHWRIGSEGKVERSNSAGVWQPALPNETVKMRVVSVFGRQVWVGGEAMRLYRSMDDGLSWTPIVLPAKNSSFPTSGQTIVHIRCQSAGSCTVEAEDGTAWTTSDDGATWQ